MPDTPWSVKLYRWLLKLYPAGFREHYSGPMEREFLDEIGEMQGIRAHLAFWMRILADLAVSIPARVGRELSQDCGYTFRLWAARPWHTGFAIAALAIGIGSNTGMFSVVNGLLLRSLPFHDPERLAVVRQQDFLPPHDSAKQFHDWRQQSRYLANAALVEDSDVNLGGERDSTRAHATITSWNFFSVLGTQLEHGRGFLPGEDSAGRNAVAVIGYGIWLQMYAGDLRALGSTIRIDGKPHVIVGVAPPWFDYPRGSTVWKPAQFSPGNNGWETIARLKPGIGWPQAQAAFDAEARSRDVPHPRLMPLRDALAGPAKQGSLMLLAGVILVLLIACTNVANLLIARTADRAAELSVRSALGASRARLVQQLLTECLLLSVAAALAGLLVAYWIASAAAKLQPPALATQSYSLLDARVLGFTVLVSVASGLLFGVLPAMYADRLHAAGLRGASSTRASKRIREVLAGAQVMLTMVLLTASVSVGRAFVKIMASDRGYRAEGIITVSVSLEGTMHQQQKRQLAYFEEALRRVRELPGIRSASATEFLPLYANGFIGGPFGLEGRPAARNSMMVPVLSDYFRTMGGRIRHGREFTDAEVRSGARVAVVNERWASGFGPPGDVVGRQLTVGRRLSWKIVGVVSGMEYDTDPTVSGGNQAFVPSQSPGGFFSTFVARVDGQPEDYLSRVRDAIRSVDPHVPVFGVKTMEQRLSEVFARPKFYRTAVWVFAGFALLLAILGIYGTISYAVVQRTREMGVRLALGTTAPRLRGMLLRQGMMVVMAGAIPGLAAARLSGRFLSSLMVGAEPAGALASVSLLLFVAAVTSASIWSATRRIDGLDISTTLRAD